jgi:hypothetical protein
MLPTKLEQAMWRERAGSRRRWRRGATLRHCLWQLERRLRWRRIANPGLALAAVLAAAIAGWYQPDLRAGDAVEWLSDPGSIVASARDMVLRPSAAGDRTDLVVLRPPVAGSGPFGICGAGRRQDCVVDGDTIWHRGVKIRLADIDTPEVFSPQCESEAALGRQATERLLELMNAGQFEVVQSGRDMDR